MHNIDTYYLSDCPIIHCKGVGRITKQIVKGKDKKYEAVVLESQKFFCEPSFFRKLHKSFPKSLTQGPLPQSRLSDIQIDRHLRKRKQEKKDQIDESYLDRIRLKDWIHQGFHLSNVLGEIPETLEEPIPCFSVLPLYKNEETLSQTIETFSFMKPQACFEGIDYSTFASEIPKNFEDEPIDFELDLLNSKLTTKKGSSDESNEDMVLILDYQETPVETRPVSPSISDLEEARSESASLRAKLPQPSESTQPSRSAVEVKAKPRMVLSKGEIYRKELQVSANVESTEEIQSPMIHYPDRGSLRHYQVRGSIEERPDESEDHIEERNDIVFNNALFNGARPIPLEILQSKNYPIRQDSLSNSPSFGEGRGSLQPRLSQMTMTVEETPLKKKPKKVYLKHRPSQARASQFTRNSFVNSLNAPSFEIKQIVKPIKKGKF